MIKTGIYRHFKGGMYELLGLAKHSETLEDMVIYKSMTDPSKVWVRPLSMWDEKVERDDYTGPRFTYIGEKE